MKVLKICMIPMLLALVVWRLAADENPEKGAGSEEQLRVEQMARFTLAMEQIHQRYVQSGQSVTYEELIDGAISGMMSRLDSYSTFIGSEDVRMFQETTEGEFGGIGVVINRRGEWVTVVSPIEDSPGWEAGLQPGDRFVEIDGEEAKGFTVQRAVQKLRGSPGTEVEVNLYRPSENLAYTVTLVREIIETPSVEPHEILEEGVGYLRVTLFAEDTAQRMRRELTAMGRKGVDAVVLDLRGNPGGLLSAAVEVAGLFLPHNSLVVTTMGKEGEAQKEYRTMGRPHRLDPEVVVLVNGGSASAAEIVSGALQDGGRAVLVGTTTFGKASVQSMVPMPDGSALKLTTATYYTPSGREIHERGIDPDVEVRFSMSRWLARDAAEFTWEMDPQIRKAVDVITGGPEGEETDEHSGD
jgi:carboxyl-terminal processing protease